MRSIPTITKNLLIINLIAFLATYVLRVGNIDLNDKLGLHFFMASDFAIYQLITYMFMHANFTHILFNMFALWMFGCVVEQTWGARKFLFYYISCGIGAALFQELAQFVSVYMTLNAQIPIGVGEALTIMLQNAHSLNAMTTVGASGAVYGILLAFGMIFPEQKIFIFPLPIPIKAKYFVMGYAAIELFSAMSTSNDNVAHLAHLGGMVVGFFMIKHWNATQKTNNSTWKQFNNLKNIFSKKQNFNTPYNNTKEQNIDWQYNEQKQQRQKEIDLILDKIRRSGYDSLTREEKQKLFDQKKE